MKKIYILSLGLVLGVGGASAICKLTTPPPPTVNFESPGPPCLPTPTHPNCTLKK